MLRHPSPTGSVHFASPVWTKNLAQSKGSRHQPSSMRARSDILHRFAFVDQFPKLAGFAELLIFRDWQFAAEQKIAKRVLVQNAVDGDAFRPFLEIDSVIFGAVAV